MRAAEFAEVSVRTVERVRKRFVEEGFDAAVYRQPATDRLYRKLDGAGRSPSHRRGMQRSSCGPTAGPSNCWPIVWSLWRSWTRSIRRRFARR